MSQTETAKAVAAEERTEETRSFVRTVNAAAEERTEETRSSYYVRSSWRVGRSD